ncbi:MAG TPA: phosphatase, partial [Ramlibacter sp.]|nr:phosphatase [Ramlibacter sp.]
MNSTTRPDPQAAMPHDGEDSNRSANPSLNDIIDARLSRRGALRVSVGSAGATVLGALSLSACGGGDATPTPTPAPTPAPTAAPTPTPISLAAFAAVAKSTADTLAVPAGYTATPIYALGDPLTATAAEFKNDG